MRIMNKKELASRETRGNILAIARRKFVDKGFHNTSLQEIVEEIGLTRGAFYHHFKNKEEILSDLMNLLQKEVADYVEARAMTSDDSWEQLILGCVAFVEKAAEREMAPLLLTDGPSILSWCEWKRMDSEHSESHLKDQLRRLQAEGRIRGTNVDYLTALLSGGLNELAMAVSRADSYDPKEVEASIRGLLEGIRNDG